MPRSLINYAVQKVLMKWESVKICSNLMPCYWYYFLKWYPISLCSYTVNIIFQKRTNMELHDWAVYGWFLQNWYRLKIKRILFRSIFITFKDISTFTILRTVLYNLRMGDILISTILFGKWAKLRKSISVRIPFDPKSHSTFRNFNYFEEIIQAVERLYA